MRTRALACLFCLLFPAFVAEGKLSVLAPEPDWPSLERYQRSISSEEFELAIRRFYSRDGAFFKYYQATSESGTVYRDEAKTQPLWTVQFVTDKTPKNPFLDDFFVTHRLSPEPGQPLHGLTICLDPGHIGGKWADVEERCFKIGNGPLVEEGELNMTVCHHIASLLEKAGAKVVWTKQDGEPVTPKRAKDFEAESILFLSEQEPKAVSSRYRSKILEKLGMAAELLFYRADEIRARAALVNYELKPDLTLCVHHNAAPWTRRRKRLYNCNRLVLFVHGSYTPEELECDDHKFHLVRKALEQSTPQEIALAESIAKQMQSVWGWPPENYTDGGIMCRVSDSPYVFARNLLANRLYKGPTVFIEGPYMNDKGVYPRIIAGDYEGEKIIQGKSCRSIFREYAEIVASGVIDYYSSSAADLAREGNLQPFPQEEKQVEKKGLFSP